MRLKELRIQHGISQGDLADKLGFKQGTISQWESGKRLIDIETLTTLADLYGVSTDYILERPTKEVSSEDPLQNKMIVVFNTLNDLGKSEAIKRVFELSELPRYKKGRNSQMPIAAHNDAVIDENELRLMQEDIDDL